VVVEVGDLYILSRDRAVGDTTDDSNGIDGADGIDGVNGIDGIDGADGVVSIIMDDNVRQCNT